MPHVNPPTDYYEDGMWLERHFDWRDSAHEGSTTGMDAFSDLALALRLCNKHAGPSMQCSRHAITATAWNYGQDTRRDCGSLSRISASHQPVHHTTNWFRACMHAGLGSILSVPASIRLEPHPPPLNLDLQPVTSICLEWSDRVFGGSWWSTPSIFTTAQLLLGPRHFGLFIGVDLVSVGHRFSLLLLELGSHDVET